MLIFQYLRSEGHVVWATLEFACATEQTHGSWKHNPDTNLFLGPVNLFVQLIKIMYDHNFFS